MTGSDCETTLKTLVFHHQPDGEGVLPVSVIIPAFNAALTLERALLSVVNQSVPPAEVIIVDDASDDRTTDVVSAFQDRHADGWIRLLRSPINEGPASARNRGWEVARQPYLAFLDADDSWHPEKLRMQCQHMRGQPELALVGHGYLVGEVASAGMVVPRARMVSKWRLLLSNPFSTPTVMLRRDLPHRFPGGRRYAEDYLLWLQIVADGYAAAFIDFPLATLYKAPYGVAGLSGELWLMEKGELSAYQQLVRERRLSRLGAFLLHLYSLAKFLRRALWKTFWLRNGR